MRAIRVGICILIAFAVLAFGGVEPWGEAILEIGAAALFAFWGILAIRRRAAEIHWNWLYLPLGGLGLFATVQYAFGLSAYPYLTKLELLKWGACVLLFFLAHESFRSLDDVRRFVWFLVIFGFAVSLFGIVQYFTYHGKLYWTIPVKAGSPFGPYVNCDDFAGFVELFAPLGLALLFFRAVRREHLTLLVLFTLVPIGAAILSASRGGIFGLFFELVLLAFLSRARQIGKKQLLGVATLALVGGTFIVWLGVSHAIQRFEQLTPGEISRNLRVSMYQDTWSIFVHHPWTGTGLGTLIAVYPRYASFYNGQIVDHAHNDYLELLADTGLVGGLCGVAFIILLFWKGLANLRVAGDRWRRAICAGSLTACAGLLLHSLVDFNLHIPSNTLIFLLLAALATSEISRPSEAHRPESFDDIHVAELRPVIPRGHSTILQ
jgi:O-antigen ligase